LSPALPPNPECPLVVLDNNVVLDWMLFLNPDGLAVGEAIEAGRMRWISTPDMRAELSHVLQSGRLSRWRPDGTLILSKYGSLSREVPCAPPAQPELRVRCTDPDDQGFIDLSVAARVRWLLTRDRAVLKVASRLRATGVEVLTPPDWVATQGRR
jgi:predicted nucleic acid-binding protein